MSDKNTKEKALKYAKTSLAFEGIYLTPEEEKLILKRANGEISFEEFKKQALEIASNTKKNEI